MSQDTNKGNTQKQKPSSSTNDKDKTFHWHRFKCKLCRATWAHTCHLTHALLIPSTPLLTTCNPSCWEKNNAPESLKNLAPPAPNQGESSSSTHWHNYRCKHCLASWGETCRDIHEEKEEKINWRECNPPCAQKRAADGVDKPMRRHDMGGWKRKLEDEDEKKGEGSRKGDSEKKRKKWFRAGDR